MKKVFAFVMALALVMVGSVALAGEPVELGSTGSGKAVATIPVNYMVTDTIDIAIAWTYESVTVNYRWQNSAWEAIDASEQSIDFEITNSGGLSRIVSLAATISDTSKVELTQQFGGSITVASGDNETDTLKFTPSSTLTDVTGEVTTSTVLQNVVITATIQ